MSDISKDSKEESKSINSKNKQFLFIQNVSGFKSLEKLESVDLCIIRTDFSPNDVDKMREIVTQIPQTTFWVSTNDVSRNNILLASELGIKNVVPNPYDTKSVEEFFSKKDSDTQKEKHQKQLDYESLDGLKVMIVDDNLFNVELLEEVLAKLNLEIKSFTKPKQAYEVLLHEKFDLFLLDVMMPEISGFDLAKKIRETPHNKLVPIIFISALSDAENKIMGFDLGSCAYIEKPFNINIVRSQIYTILKNQKSIDMLNQNKETFLATVAHDLKTPIKAEINALKLLLTNNFGSLDKEQQEILEDILNSTKYMQDLIDNLLSKNRIEHNAINLSLQPCYLRDVANHCIELTKYLLLERKQKITLKNSAPDTIVNIDPMEMERAIQNLLANASQYSPVGGEILVNVYKAGDDRLGISVQDFGPGIPHENKEDIFHQYISYAKQHKTVGVGLGLYVTKRIVESHGGEISVESKVGFGTKISILLPVYTKV